MRRSISVLLWILLGAVASGSSLSYFLVQANRDRASLIREAERAKAGAEEVKSVTERLAEDANEKIGEAARQMERAHAELSRYQAERDMISRARTLEKPDARTLRYWTEGFSLALGISLRLPPGNQIEVNDGTLTVKAPGGTADHAREQWLSITAYDPSREEEVTRGLTETEPVTFWAGGRLLLGVRGTLADLPGNVIVLRTSSAATTTHLIWARETSGVNEYKILQSLATLQFRS